MKAEFALDDAAALARFEREQRLLEGQREHAATAAADVAAARGRAILGFGFGELGEVGAGLQLREQLVRALLGGGLVARDALGVLCALVAHEDVTAMRL